MLRHLKHMLAGKVHAQKRKRERSGKSEHFKALPYAELPAFMAKLRANDSVSARALEWTILTAARTNETVGAQFSEIDRDKRTWTIPAQRMKAGKEHVIPLSDRSMQLLGARAEDDYLFPGATGGNGLFYCFATN
jgi:integrase